MKKYFLSILFIALLFSFTASVNAQFVKGNKNVVKEKRETGEFQNIEVGGAFHVYLLQGEASSVEVEADENLQPQITMNVNKNTLKIHSKGIRNATKLNIYITNPVFEKIDASGASEINGKNKIQGNMMEVTASGAADVNLDIDVKTLHTVISGAATVQLSGKAGNHSTEVSGAGTLKAQNLISEKTYADASGAGDIKINSSGEIIGNESGAGKISTKGISGNTNIRQNEVIVHSNNNGDTTRVRIPGLNVEVGDDQDSVKVRVGSREMIVDEDGNVKYRRCHRTRFNGNWAGVDIGFNGFVNSDFNSNLPKEDEYLDLRMEKSIAVGLNFFEQNIPLSKNKKWGMLTGLGLSFNNYHFKNDTRLNMDSSALIGYIDQGIGIRKSKLTAMYLNVPLLFEFQTNGWHNRHSFHLGLGMIAGARLASWTKKYYEEFNKQFDVTLYNPETGNYDVAFTAISPNHNKVHDYGDWFLRPFKLDATVRIGWGFINLFATYSVNSMFRDGKGPELYPWTAGICLVNF